ERRAGRRPGARPGAPAGPGRGVVDLADRRAVRRGPAPGHRGGPRRHGPPGGRAGARPPPAGPAEAAPPQPRRARPSRPPGTGPPGPGPARAEPARAELPPVGRRQTRRAVARSAVEAGVSGDAVAELSWATVQVPLAPPVRAGRLVIDSREYCCLRARL